MVLAQGGAGRFFVFNAICHEGHPLTFNCVRRVGRQFFKGRGAESEFVPAIAVKDCDCFRNGVRVPFVVKWNCFLWGSAPICRASRSIDVNEDVVEREVKAGAGENFIRCLGVDVPRYQWFFIVYDVNQRRGDYHRDR